MFDMLKKSILAGIGAIAVTEEKTRETIQEFVAKGKLTQQEGETLLGDVQKMIEDNKTKLTTLIDERLNCLMKDLHLVTRDDLTTLEKNINARLTTIQQQIATLQPTPQTPDEAK